MQTFLDVYDFHKPKQKHKKHLPTLHLREVNDAAKVAYTLRSLMGIDVLIAKKSKPVERLNPFVPKSGHSVISNHPVFLSFGKGIEPDCIHWNLPIEQTHANTLQPFREDRHTIGLDETADDSDKEVASANLLHIYNIEESRDAWLNLASEDTLRRLWDTPEEDEAWRDLLEEI